jgi:hypothetical protein
MFPSHPFTKFLFPCHVHQSRPPPWKRSTSHTSMVTAPEAMTTTSMALLDFAVCALLFSVAQNSYDPLRGIVCSSVCTSCASS